MAAVTSRWPYFPPGAVYDSVGQYVDGGKAIQ
jgi:hypothetical protein